MNKNLRELAWVEMKSTWRCYDRQTRATLICMILVFAALIIIQSLNPYGSDNFGKATSVMGLVLMSILYGVCFDSLKRILDENMKLKEKSQTEEMSAVDEVDANSQEKV